MPTVNQILVLAKSQVGTTEYPPNSNNVIYNTAYYGHDVSGDEYKWCCVFIWWIFNQFKPCIIPKTASCKTLAEWFKSQGRWHASPKIGDVVFFKFGKTGNWTNHVGVVEDIIDDGVKIIDFEGNTSISSDDNGGAVMERTRTSNIVGFGRPAYSEDIPVELDDNYTHGIDVSKYQGKIDWDTVKASGVSFAILRSIMQDGYVDPFFETNLAECMRLGIDYSCYRYCYAQTHDAARREADLVINLLKDRKMPIWYDMEDAGLPPLGKDTIEGVVLSFIGECKEAGFDVGIYCNKTWYDNYISQYLKDRYNFWIARYKKQDDGQIHEDIKPSWKNVVCWQYTSKGSVPGIVGNVDCDVLF